MHATNDAEIPVIHEHDASAAPATGWRRVHARCLELAKRAAALDREIGRALLEAERERVFAYLGFAGIIEYGDRIFGLGPRATLERLRVARALEALPGLDAALAVGALCYSAVRELSRVAEPDTEAEWLAAAAGQSMRQIEEQVNGRVPGDRPSDPARPEARRHVLRFEVTADVLALVRQAVGALRKAHGGDLDEAQALALMARLALGGPRDDGRASHQLVLAVCTQCGQARQHGHGVLVPVDQTVAERAACDAQRIEDGKAKQEVPPATRRAVLNRDHGRCRAPGCRGATFLDVHHVRARADGGGHEASNLIALCGHHHDAVHRGALVIEGDANAELVFRHADGTAYGGATTLAAVQAFTDAFVALRTLGFKECEARAAVDAVRAHVSTGEPPSIETVLRRCLAELRSPTQPAPAPPA